MQHPAEKLDINVCIPSKRCDNEGNTINIISQSTSFFAPEEPNYDSEEELVVPVQRKRNLKDVCPAANEETADSILTDPAPHEGVANVKPRDIPRAINLPRIVKDATEGPATKGSIFKDRLRQ